MGHNRRWRVLADADRYDADYLIRCRRCGREIVVERATFRAVATSWGLGSQVERIAALLRCEACGQRGAILELAAAGLPGRLRLREGDALPPRGFSLVRWLRLPDAERRRYKRSLR
jgi:DNA-directed RNA polymerase subunit RPC12/RpoP